MVATLQTTKQHRKHARRDHGASCRRLLAGLTLSTALLLTGCASIQQHSLTCRVWDTDDFLKFSEPAPDPNLALFKTRDVHEVLVQYDAWSEKHDAIKRRAYYLRLNQARIAGGKKPRFVNPSQAVDLTPIPVLKWDSMNTNAPTDLTEYAVTAKDGRRFDLVPSTGRKETHELPVYPESSGTAMRLALTPFALAGDTVMVAGVVAYVGIVALAESHTSFGTH